MTHDLELHRHGLGILERPLSKWRLCPTGAIKGRSGANEAEVAKVSARDAERLDAYRARLERVTDVLRALALATPPKLETGHGVAAGSTPSSIPPKSETICASSTSKVERDLLELFTRSAGDMLDQWFESDPIKAILGFDGIVGTYDSPYAAGTGYVLLHHCWGEVNGKKSVWAMRSAAWARSPGNRARLRRAWRRDSHDSP